MNNSLLRARAMIGIPETIKELGGDPQKFLAEFHITQTMIEDPKQMVPYLSLINMMEKAAEEFDCPDFGLRVGLKQGMSVLGPIAVIAQNSKSVEDALNHIIKYIGFHSAAIYLHLDKKVKDQYRGLFFDITMTQGQSRSQTLEMSMLLASQVVRLLAGDDTHSFPVYFRHAKISSSQKYRTVFKSPVKFDQRSNVVWIPETILDSEIHQRDEALQRMMEDFVQQNIATCSTSVKDNVRALIIRLLPLERRCTISLVASNLALTERTLQRKLKKENIVFEDLVDEIRRELAEDYLKESAMSINQVAGLIGYGQQSSFNRACMRWFGKAPKVFREEMISS